MGGRSIEPAGALPESLFSDELAWIFPSLEVGGADLELLRASRPLEAGVALFAAACASYPLHIKARLTGTESPGVGDDHRSSRAFPHHTTADPFFDETQLEAYRALGEHIARDIWPAPHGEPVPADLDALLTGILALDQRTEAT